MNDCTFIIFGATGDLAKRKLIPALYKLLQDNKIDRLVVIGVARDHITAEQILERARAFIPLIDEDIWNRLRQAIYYYPLDVTAQQGFTALSDFITKKEREYSLSGNRLIYLAVPSQLFCPITHNLGKSGIISRLSEEDNKPWQRIVYEKPFGIDTQSAQEINDCIHTYVHEKQVYRIDHYLTKDLVSSILLVRFTNMFFEPLWNKKYIDHVQIILDESLGIESRGRYYDHYGVLKDVVQNHMMQLLSLVAMELPRELTAHDIRDEKARVLQHVRCDGGFFGQYQGYTQEKDVAPHSKTPTFAALRMEVNTPRWQGVPFYFKTGKCLDKKNSSIHIKFKEVECTLRERCLYTSNYLTIQVDPEATFSLQLNTKKPGSLYEVTPAVLKFSHNYVSETATPEAYEVLLEHIMIGEQSISVRFDEIEYAWKIIQQIESLSLSSYPYEQGSMGPTQLEEFTHKYGIRWRA